MSTYTLTDEKSISETLSNFVVIRSPILRQALTRGPVILVLFLVIDALIGRGIFTTNDTFRLSNILLAFIELVLLSILFAKVPETLRTLWNRKLIRASVDGQPVNNKFSHFLTEFSINLNSNKAWLVGAGFAVIGLFSTYPVLAWLQWCSDKELVNQLTSLTDFCAKFGTLEYLLRHYFWGNLGIAAPLLGSLLGLLVWRVGVIALYMTKFSKQFVLDIQFKHPDGVGGYRTFGNLCLLNALLIALPTLYVSIWSFILVNNSESEIIQTLWGPLFRILLIVLLNVAAIWLFFGPIYGVHLQMKRRKEETLALLDTIASDDGQKDSNELTEWQSSLNQQRVGLRTLLENSFNEDELSTLCFDLGVEFENIGGETKIDKSREIVTMFERKQRLDDLIEACRRLRPTVDWPDITDLTRVSKVVMELPPANHDLASVYQTFAKTPVWPLTNSVLLVVIAIQASIVGGLIVGIAVAGNQIPQ